MNTSIEERPALLSFLESAHLLGISASSLRRLIAAGSLEPVRIAGLTRPRYRRADIEKLVEEGRSSP
jgi:excisionase family DNA binding protein